MVIFWQRMGRYLAFLGVACALFWAYHWYEQRYLKRFVVGPAVFSGEHLQLPPKLQGFGPIRFVHFWDPACPCNVGNQQHLAELLAHYGPHNVAFYVVQKAGSHGQLPLPLQDLQPLPGLIGDQTLPASPAAAIWNTQGELVYVGPYSEGAICNTDNSFIEPLLEALLDGRPVQASYNLAEACFCDWPNDPP